MSRFMEKSAQYSINISCKDVRENILIRREIEASENISLKTKIISLVIWNPAW